MNHHVEFCYLFIKMRTIFISKTTLLCLFLLVINGVFGADTVKSVTEGDSVTLNTGVTEIQRNEQILWMFGPQETRIAELYKLEIDMFESNVTFGDRLKMDRQTGSLTVRNIRPEHSGLYKLQIRSNRGNSDTTFNINVYAHLPLPNISRKSIECTSSLQKCSVVCSVVNVHHVTLSWIKGNSVLSSISVSDLSISLSLPLEVDFQDNNTYSCEINNTITHQNTQLNISTICILTGCLRSRLYAALIPAVILILLVIVTYLIYRKCKRSEQKGNYYEPPAQVIETVQTNVEEVTYTETEFVPKVQHKKPNGTEEVLYSTVMKP